MSLKTILAAIGGFFSKIFTSIEKDVAPVAVAIVQTVKNLSDEGILDTVDKFLGGIIPQAALDKIKSALPKILADLLALEGLAANPSPEQVKAFSDAVIASFASLDFQKKSQAYTTLGVQVYNLIEDEVNKTEAGTKLSFGQIVILIEQAYEDYLAAEAAATSGDAE